jgi:hypothetical protein
MRDAEIDLRLANAADFPVAEEFSPSRGPDHEQMVARLEVLPDQAIPRIRITKAKPRLTAAVATLLDRRTTTWQTTVGVQFRVTSGRVDEFAIDFPEASALTVSSSTPASVRTTTRQSAEGRVTYTFQTDEPVTDRLVVMLAGETDLSQPEWRVPEGRLAGIDFESNYLIVPRGMVEPSLNSRPLESGAMPDWFLLETPGAAPEIDQWTVFRWTPRVPEPAFRMIPADASAMPDAKAQVELWLTRDGSAHGWLELDFEDRSPGQIEFTWPESARPLALFAAGQFLPLPPAIDGHIAVSIPPTIKDRRVWLAWSEQIGSLPIHSGPLAAKIPWPRNPIRDPCRVRLHGPADVLVSDLSASVPGSSTSEIGVPPLLLIPKRDHQIAERTSKGPLLLIPNPPAGEALELAKFVKLSRPIVKTWSLVFCGLILAILLLQATGPVWRWLEIHDRCAWFVLALVWWLVLWPSWLGFALVILTSFRLLNFRSRPQA